MNEKQREVEGVTRTPTLPDCAFTDGKFTVGDTFEVSHSPGINSLQL